MKIFDVVMGSCMVAFFVLFLLSGYFFPTDHYKVVTEHYTIYYAGLQVRNILIVLSPIFIALVTCLIKLFGIDKKVKKPLEDR